MTTQEFNQSVTREIQRIMREAEEKRKADELSNLSHADVESIMDGNYHRCPKCGCLFEGYGAACDERSYGDPYEEKERDATAESIIAHQKAQDDESFGDLWLLKNLPVTYITKAGTNLREPFNQKCEEWPSVEEQLKYWKDKENDGRTS